MAQDIKQVNMPRMGGPKVGGIARFSNNERAKDQKGTLMRLIKVYMRFKGTIISAVILTVLASTISVFIPYFVGKAFNAFDSNTQTVNGHMLYIAVGIIAALYITNWIITTISDVTVMAVSQKLVSVLRRELFVKLEKLPLLFFDTTPRGDTMSRITNDTDTISTTIAQSAI